jgi:hypothetical protein
LTSTGPRAKIKYSAFFPEVIMLAYAFVLFAIAVRFLPHPWSLTPVAACLLFFGARGPRKQIWAPFALLIFSDLLLTKFVYALPFSWDQPLIWAWYAGILWMGTRLRTHQKPLPVLGAALASSMSFFLISNFAVWAATFLYPKTWEGLMASYTLGIPFFRRGLEGDVLFTVVMFATPLALHALGMDSGKAEHSAA